MRPALRLMVVVSAIILLAFAVHDVVRLGMGISSSASHAPKQFWEALVDAFTWGIEYKEGATAAFIVGLVALYLIRSPAANR